MVFFNSSMATSIQRSSTSAKDKTIKSSEHGKKVRTLPGVTEIWKTNVWKTADPAIVSQYRTTITNRKLLFMHSLLKAQITQLADNHGALEAAKLPSLFASYTINRTNLLFENNLFKMYEAANTRLPQFVIMVKVYALGSMNPEKSLYLKILRHLGRKHPYIVHTWEIFYDTESIYVFQELIVNGSLVAYLENETIDEQQAVTWTRQIYRALDFLGDIGIAHRAITPSHLLVRGGKGGCIKLTGFRNAIVYWSVDQEDIKFYHCWPAERAKSDGPNFQAPEVYGDPEKEVFDPIKADIWSFGANIYYMLAKQYPFNILIPSDNIEEEIQHNVEEMVNLSANCKQFLMNMMKVNSNDRIPFHCIPSDPWLGKASSPKMAKNEKRSKSKEVKSKVLQSRTSSVDTSSINKPSSVLKTSKSSATTTSASKSKIKSRKNKTTTSKSTTKGKSIMTSTNESTSDGSISGGSIIKEESKLEKQSVKNTKSLIQKAARKMKRKK